MRITKRSSFSIKSNTKLLEDSTYEIKYHADLINKIMDMMYKVIDEFEDTGELDTEYIKHGKDKILDYKSVIDENFNNIIKYIDSIK